MKCRKTILSMLAACLLMVLGACRIEPPLKLADTVSLQFGLMEMDLHIETIWGVDSSWRNEWWYGWDEEDIRRFGELDYPAPTNYTGIFYFLGGEPADRANSLNILRDHITGNTFRRQMAIGWHDVLLWSNIDSPDGTQVLIIDDSNLLDVHATTTGTRLNYGSPSRGGVYNNPEIFYSGMPETFYIGKDPQDYDYYDAEHDVYVKHIDANLRPLVYTYLVQIVLYHNSNRITGMAERSSMTSLSDGVNVHTGHTHNNDVAVAFETRMKRGLPARNKVTADIFGGKLTTFGLCDMDSRSLTQSRSYTGSRSELDNQVVANFAFSNGSDSTYSFKVTDQMRRQAHGGVITIELDVDTLKIPQSTSHGGAAGFDPWIDPFIPVDHDYDI